MPKVYTSFKEIDSELNTLKLKREINWLCLKSDYQRLLRNMSPKHIFEDALIGIKQSFVSKKNNILTMGIEYIVRKFFN